MDAEWLEVMPETITISRYLSRDAYTEATYDAPVSMRARIEEDVREILTGNGMERLAGTVVYPYNPPFVPSVRDRVTLPDGSTPPVLGVNGADDDKGPHHYEIFLGTKPPR